jgi:transcription-repair coupling factor (superfamily II helicase)
MLTVIVANASDGQRLLDEIPWFADGKLACHLLPDWETLPYDAFSPHQDLVSERLATLHEIRNGQCDVLMVPATTALVRLAPPSFLAAYTFFFRQGEKLDEAKLKAQLTLAGYTHVSQVMSPGEYSVRGGLIDLFPMGSALPYRLDLFGDEIETIRTFDADTQRSLYPVGKCACCRAANSRWTSGAHRLPQPLARTLRGRPFALARLQGHRQRHRLGRHRILPAAVLRRDRDPVRLPAADASAGAGRRHRRRDPALLADTESRYKFLKADRERPILPPKELFLGAENISSRWPSRTAAGPSKRRRRRVRAVGADPQHRRQPPPRRPAGQPARLPAANGTRA